MYFKFNNETHFYQNFIKNNLDILGDLIIIKEQLNINNKFFIDMLVYDKINKKLIIMELKNNYTKFKVIGQVITYYDLLKKSNIENIMEEFLKINNIDISTCDIDFNPAIYIIVPDFNNQLLQDLNYLNIDNIRIFKINAKQNKGYFEIIKEEYKPQKIKENIELKNDFNKDYNIDSYFLSKNKKFLIISLLNFLKSKYNCKFFFLKNKISIFYGKRILLYILIDKKYNLTITFNYNEDVYKNLVYLKEVINYKLLNNKIKIEVNSIPQQIIEILLGGKK